MGLFGFLGRAITGPFRGIGKLLQGDIKGMLGAFGDTLKVGAPFIPGIGIPTAIGLSALGGGLQTLDDPNQGLGSWLKNIAGGAAWGGGLKGIGALLSKAAPAAAEFSPTISMPSETVAQQIAGAAPSIGPELVPATVGAGAGAAEAAGGGLSNWLGNAGQRFSQGLQNIYPWMKKTAGDVFGWAESNPYLASQAMATGANMLGAAQQQRMYNEQQQLYEQQLEEQRKRQQFQDFMNMMAAFRPRY